MASVVFEIAGLVFLGFSLLGTLFYLGRMDKRNMIQMGFLEGLMFLWALKMFFYKKYLGR